MSSYIQAPSMEHTHGGRASIHRLRISAAILALLFLAPPTFGETPEVCHQYAQKALEQLKQAKDLGISPLAPPTWSDEVALHFGWCLTASAADVANGQALRQSVIDEYEKVPPPPADAGAEAPKNMQMVEGAKVDSDKNMQMIEAGVIAPDAAHGVCDAYAKEAVAQQQKNIATNCNRTGPEWNDNYSYHYDWCVKGDNSKGVAKFTADRQSKLDACSAGPCPMTVPGMTLGLRHSGNNVHDPFRPDTSFLSACQYSLTALRSPDREDCMDCLPKQWGWQALGAQGKPAIDYSLPPGIVVGLSGSEFTTPTAFGEVPWSGPEFLPGGTFQKMHGGDLNGAAGEGLYWYESTGLGFTDWHVIDQLPRGTIVGLRHSDNQPGAPVYWQGTELDATNAALSPPPGFARKHGGDMGASAGHGYYWYEKITGN